MENMILKTIRVGTFAVLMLTLFTQIPVSAQDRGNEEDSGIQARQGSPGQNRPGRALEGVWDIQVTARNCQTGVAVRSFPAMQTFMRGGTMNDWGTGNAPALRSPGQGVWSYESQRNYSSAFQFFRFNADGTLAGKQIGRAQIELSHDGNSYTTTGMGQVFDVNGNVIQTGCSTATATRFQ